MDMVKIVHPDAGESTVPVSAVPAWRSSGWEVAATVTTEQDEAPAEVRQAAETISAALARHGVVATGAATIAAAYDVLAAQGTADPAEVSAPAGDPGEEPAPPGAEPSQHEAKPERRTRRPSPKESE